MVYELLTFGGVLFWIAFAVAVLVISAFIADDKVGKASFGLILMIAFLIAFTNTPIVSTVKEHPIYVLYGLGAYLGVAAIWATIKWRLFYLPKLFGRYEAIRADFLAEKELTEMPAGPIRDQFNKLHEVQRLNINTNRMVRYNKGRITSWIVFWPFSLIGTFFGDFLLRMFDYVYRAISGTLQGMSDRMASKYSELG